MISLEDIFIGIINLDHAQAGYDVKNILIKDLNIPETQINVLNFKKPKSKAPCAHITSLNHNHQNVLKLALAKGYKYALIFEDDAKVCKDLSKCREVFNNVLLSLDTFTWDIVFLGSTPSLPLIPANKYIYKSLFSKCAHAYFISKPAMERTISHKFPDYGEDKGCLGITSFNVLDWKLYPYMNNYTVYPPVMCQSRCPGVLRKVFGDCNHERYQDITNKVCIIAFYVISFYIIYKMRKLANTNF